MEFNASITLGYTARLAAEPKEDLNRLKAYQAVVGLQLFELARLDRSTFNRVVSTIHRELRSFSTQKVETVLEDDLIAQVIHPLLEVVREKRAWLSLDATLRKNSVIQQLNEATWWNGRSSEAENPQVFLERVYMWWGVMDGSVHTTKQETRMRLGNINRDAASVDHYGKWAAYLLTNPVEELKIYSKEMSAATRSGNLDAVEELFRAMMDTYPPVIGSLLASNCVDVDCLEDYLRQYTEASVGAEEIARLAAMIAPPPPPFALITSSTKPPNMPAAAFPPTAPSPPPPPAPVGAAPPPASAVRGTTPVGDLNVNGRAYGINWSLLTDRVYGARLDQSAPRCAHLGLVDVFTDYYSSLSAISSALWEAGISSSDIDLTDGNPGLYWHNVWVVVADRRESIHSLLDTLGDANPNSFLELAKLGIVYPASQGVPSPQSYVNESGHILTPQGWVSIAINDQNKNQAAQVIERFIEAKIGNKKEVNKYLYAWGLPLLGEGSFNDAVFYYLVHVMTDQHLLPAFLSACLHMTPQGLYPELLRQNLIRVVASPVTTHSFMTAAPAAVRAPDNNAFAELFGLITPSMWTDLYTDLSQLGISVALDFKGMDGSNDSERLLLYLRYIGRTLLPPAEPARSQFLINYYGALTKAVSQRIAALPPTTFNRLLRHPALAFPFSGVPEEKPAEELKVFLQQIHGLGYFRPLFGFSENHLLDQASFGRGLAFVDTWRVENFWKQCIDSRIPAQAFPVYQRTFQKPMAARVVEWIVQQGKGNAVARILSESF